MTAANVYDFPSHPRATCTYTVQAGSDERVQQSPGVQIAVGFNVNIALPWGSGWEEGGEKILYSITVYSHVESNPRQLSIFFKQPPFLDASFPLLLLIENVESPKFDCSRLMFE